jgi:hypothetical protein
MIALHPSTEHSTMTVPERRPQIGRRSFALLALAAIATILALRLWELQRLPGEIYGDIVIVYDYVAAVLAGQWPTRFVLSNGPLYQYLVAPLIWASGLDYMGLKLASVCVSLLVLAATYALGRELLNEELALLSLFIAGVSSWLLVFSRLGNSQILLPLLSAGAIIFALRAARRPGRVDIIFCALVSAQGLYLYPQSFVLPPVIFITLVCLWLLGAGIRPKHLLVFALVTLLYALPFGLIVLGDPSNFFSGYIGEKLPSGREQVGLLLKNVGNGLLALHLRGDVVFRSNPASLPHLDPVSGGLFMLGVVFWLLPARRRLSPALFVPLLLLQAPSFLVRYSVQVPSASRTLGITPLVYLLVASGLWWALDAARRLRWASALLLIFSLAPIVGINAYRYFVLYEQGLPDHNTPFGQVIADYLDGQPAEMRAYVLGCCWGEWEQPHPKGIQYALRVPRELSFPDPKAPACEALASARRPAVVVWSPANTSLGAQLVSCLGARRIREHVSPLGTPVFISAELPP